MNRILIILNLSILCTQLCAQSQEFINSRFAGAKMEILCETGKFYLHAERHPQSDFDMFCSDCSDCANNWQQFFDKLNIEYSRKEIFLEICDTNFEKYGEDNKIEMQIQRLIWAIDRKLLKQLSNPSNKAKAGELVASLNKIKEKYRVKFDEIAEQNRLKTEEEVQKKNQEEQQKIDQQMLEARQKAKQDSIKKAREIEIAIEKKRIEDEGDPKQQWVRKAFGVLLSIVIHLFMLGCIFMYGKEIYKLCIEKDNLYRFASVMLGLLLCFGAYSANMSLYHFLLKANIKFENNHFGQLLIIVGFFVSGIGISITVKKMIFNKEKEWYIPYIMLVFAPIALFYFLDLYLRTSVTLQPKFLIPNVALVAGMLYKIIFDKERIEKIMNPNANTNP
jgi:hypothetical protein